MKESRIEHLFLKENQLVGLGLPGQGFLFYRCLGVEKTEYEYTESPSSVAADTFEDSSRLPMSAYSIDNLLRVTSCNHLYQVFMGWKPGCIRQYLYYPYETSRRNLDVKKVYSKSMFGFLRGFDSPFDDPSPETEIWIPRDVDVGFGWWNPTQSSETVTVKLVIRRLAVDILRDVDLVSRILSGSQPCRLVSVGGIQDSFSYAAREKLDVDPVKLNFQRSEIEAAIKESKA